MAWTQRVRHLVQFGFAAFILYARIQHNLAAEDGATASLDALCPSGALETAWRYITHGQFLSHIHLSTLVLGIAVLLSVSPTPAAPAPASTTAASSAAAHVTPTSLPAGQVLPANQIKGSMSLRSVSTQCAVPLAQMVNGLNLPTETDPDSLIKDLVRQGKISEVSAVQQVVAGLQSE